MQAARASSQVHPAQARRHTRTTSRVRRHEAKARPQALSHPLAEATTLLGELPVELREAIRKAVERAQARGSALVLPEDAVEVWSTTADAPFVPLLALCGYTNENVSDKERGAILYTPLNDSSLDAVLNLPHLLHLRGVPRRLFMMCVRLYLLTRPLRLGYSQPQPVREELYSVRKETELGRRGEVREADPDQRCERRNARRARAPQRCVELRA